MPHYQQVNYPHTYQINGTTHTINNYQTQTYNTPPLSPEAVQQISDTTIQVFQTLWHYTFKIFIGWWVCC